MADGLSGEIAVVTGATKGIGAAIARALASAGALVAVTSRDPIACEEMAASLGAGHLGLAIDVGSTDSVEAVAAAVAERLGEPTILVNNAGVNRIAPSETYTDEDWEHVVNVNLTGVFRCCRAFGRRMLAASGGSIVNVGSIVGAVTGMPWRAPYAASKAGVVGLTRELAVEWAGRGVRVNAVIPGPVLTPMVVDAIERGILDDSEIVARTPAGRIADPADIAGAVVLLCSADARFVTAQALVVDGGYTNWGAAHDVSLPFGARPTG